LDAFHAVLLGNVPDAVGVEAPRATPPSSLTWLFGTHSLSRW
jgi:hypothetical protein